MNSENEIKMVQVTEQVDTHDQDIQIYPQIVNERVETHEDAKVVVEEQDIQIDPQIVSEPVETHEDAKVVVEEQNIQIDPQIDEELNEPHVSKKVRLHEEQFVAIDTPHVSKKVCLHENAQEANEGQTGILEVEQVETHESVRVSVQEQIIKIEPPNTTLGVYVPYPHFADLHPNGSKWKVKARLVRMVEVMNPLLPGVTLRLVCLDEQGDAMEAIVWPEEVEYFRHHLYEGQVYLFRGVDVVPADDKYNFVPCCFKMSFTDDTRVEHVFIKCDKTPLHWDFLIRLQDIHHFTHKYVQLIDVVGLVVNVTQSRQTQNRNFMIRDVVLLNKSMTFVRLTLWNEFAMRDGMRLLDNLHSNQVLFATGLKVDYFHGPYLCTCMKSKLYVNHSFRTDGILEWLAKDRSAQKLVAWNRTHGFSLPQALIISNAKRIRIKQFAFMPNVQYYRIIGRIEKIYVEHLWIDLCKSCLKQVEDQYGWFVCTHCGQDDAQSVTRYNVKMIVRDSTGSMELLLKDKKAEFILQCVAPYLKELLSKDNGLQMLKDYIAQYYGRAYVFIISAPETVCLDHCASVVTFVLKVDWTEEFSYLFKGMSRTGNTTMRSS